MRGRRLKGSTVRLFVALQGLLLSRHMRYRSPLRGMFLSPLWFRLLGLRGPR